MNREELAGRFYRHFRIGLLFVGLFLFTGILTSSVQGWGPTPALAALKDGEKGEALLVLAHRAKANFFVTMKKVKEIKK